MSQFIRWFETLGLGDVGLVGGKNASLGEMVQKLGPLGIRVPEGFAVTADAYTAITAAPAVKDAIARALAGLDVNQPDDLAARGRAIRTAIREGGLTGEVAADIRAAYAALAKRTGIADPDVAVRSSATAEDLPDASFAGQQETFLNIRGEAAVLEACLHCFASLFTDRAIVYRTHNGFDHLAVRLSVGVQRMVRSDLASAGVIFTLDTETGFRDVVLVTSAYGLGENVVAGRVDPDEVVVFKPTLREGNRPIIRRRIGKKQQRMVYSGHGTRTTRNLDVPPEEQARASVSDDEALELARWAVAIEEHYSRRYGRPTPMDIEWAKDGRDGRLYIVQARPETVHARRDVHVIERFSLKARGEVLARGRAIGDRIGQGRVRVMRSPHELGAFVDGEVLVADMTDPDWEPIMKRASAIVTNRGGRTCHAAIVSRELGVPCVVGAGTATGMLATGREVTVSCAEGEEGLVLAGLLPFEQSELRLDDLPKPRTRVLVNVGNPEQAFALQALPVDGVGLARLEFIIAHELKVHPLALTRFDQVTDPAARAEIERLTRGSPSREEYFIRGLAEGIGTIAAAFFPREVIVRLSDFKTNEYAGLLGGAAFEPAEENPMIGFRGASRYAHERYRDGFALECQALARVRRDMGLANVKVMVPFCRTIAEARAVTEEMAKHGLRRGEAGLELYVMCEIPANVICIDRFAELFDGFSIGSNDLTQLVLGVDRDSGTLAHLFDERDEAVQRAITSAIAGAHAAGRKIGICGQAPSDYPEFAELLVERGIDSISLNPDAVLRTIPVIAGVEHRLDDAPRTGHRHPRAAAAILVEAGARMPTVDMDDCC